MSQYDTWDGEEEVSSSSKTSKEFSCEYFTPSNGRVRIQFPVLVEKDGEWVETTKKVSFRIVDDLFIKDALEQGGRNIHSCVGQRHKYLLSSIPKPKKGESEEMSEARYATVKYLEDIDRAIKESETNRFIETAFGLRFLDFGVRGRVKPKRTVKAW